MKKPKRIKRDDVIDAFRQSGELTRSDLEKLFKIEKGTSIQAHITALRDDAQLYVADWRPPEKTGMWSPIYALRTDANEQDAPHPPPRDRWRKIAEVPEDLGEPVVIRGVGLKKEHVHVARTRSETLGLGMWGGLIAPWGRRAAI